MVKSKGAVVAAKGKQAIKSVNNKAISKKQKKAEEDIMVAVKKEVVENNKKKIPQKLVPSEDEDSEEEEDASDSGADVKEEVVADDDDEDDEDDFDEGDDDDDEEDDEDDEDDEDEDEVENAVVKQEDDESDDEQPTEQAIQKKAGGIPRIKTTPLPEDFPSNQTVLVKCLPKVVKLIDIFEVFGKFGDLDTICLKHGPVNSSATLGYMTVEAAQSALNLDKTTKIKDTLIKVFPKVDKTAKGETAETKNKTIMVRGIKCGTTEDEIKAHFASYGPMSKVRIYPSSKTVTKAIITFKEGEAVAKAKSELDLSQLNGLPISIMPLDEDVRDPERTVILKCSPDLYEKVSYELIKKMFKDEVVNITLVNGKDVLGFVLFKDREGAKNALKLSGIQRDNITFEIIPYGNTKVFVTNIKPGTTEEELHNLFERCGEIKKITFKTKHNAIVNFADQDAFCKAFTLNESYLNGKRLFLEPYSLKKLHLNFSLSLNRNPNKPQMTGSNPMKRKFPTNPNIPQMGGSPPFKRQMGGNFANKPQQGGKFPNKPQQGGKFPNKSQSGGKFPNKQQSGGQKPPFKNFKSA